MKLNIAIVQFEIAQFMPSDNLRKAEQFIKRASFECGAQIIVFPEDFLTGPLKGNAEYADCEGQYVKRFQQLASTYAIDIVPGSFIEGDGACLYNTTYYIDRTGTIQGRYRKVNLWISERSYISPGSEISISNTRYGKVGLIICWDLMFPEIFRAMVRAGVETVICPSYWCYEDAGEGIKHDANSEIKLVNALCIARAFENEVILAYANAAGKLSYGESGFTLIGQSQVALPFKGATKMLEHNKEEMFVQEVDTAILRDAEAAYKIREDLEIGVLS